METTEQAILDYFSPLGFESIPIEDNLTALCFESDPAGEYALLTNEDGIFPLALDAPFVLAFYTAEGSYLWSTGFKNATQFREIWSTETEYAAKVKAAERHRDAIRASL